MQQHHIAKLCWIAVIAVAVGATAAAADPTSEAQAAEQLVRQTYYEGLSFEDARSITDAGAARLAAMLFDPAERSHFTNIILALGIAARPGAYQAIAGVAERGSSGEVDGAEYQLRSAIPIAMGHLARSDERAFNWLVVHAETRGSDPGWRSGPFSGQELADQLRRRAIDGIGLSGRPDGEAILNRIANQSARRAASGDPELATQVEEARGLNARIAAEGADAALDSRRGE